MQDYNSSIHALYYIIVEKGIKNIYCYSSQLKKGTVCKDIINALEYLLIYKLFMENPGRD